VDRGTPLAGRIVHPAGEGVVYGPGSTGRALAGLLTRMDVVRPFVVTTASVARAGLAAEVIAALGVEPVGVFDGSREHTPAPVVLAAAVQARAAGADCLVSVGGSSVVDLTKGVALLLAEDPDLDGRRLQRGAARPGRNLPKLAHVALPTTLSGAEFTGAAGITDPESGEKRGYMDPQLTPRWVILDPELTRATPPSLWAGTGMKVLADTVELLCSQRGTPLSDATASGALAILGEHLAASTADPDDLVARGWCQFAVAMTLPQLTGVGLGLIAALRHQLGGSLGVPHGVASTIVFPHVVRWNAPECGRQLGRIAAALGLADADAGAVAGRIEDLTDELGLPRRLRDVGVSRDDLPGVAELVLADGSAATNPRPVGGAQDVIEILDAAF
jgi:alcohol dehydrogenase class IV